MAGIVVLGALVAGCASTTVTLKSVPERDRPTVAEASTCAADQPVTWMGCLVHADPAFGTMPISGLALPGSDNAGTFNLDPESFDTQAGSACTAFTPQDASLGSTVNRWSQTQDETTTEQLDQGVRFIDLQVAYNGNGSALTGWRVVQSQYSEWPLYDYLDQVADWAKAHPSEVVIVDLRDVCYDNQPDAAVDKGLFSNLATPSDVGGGTTTLAKVAYDAGTSSRAFATTSIDQVVQQGGGGHNVVVLLPGDVRDAKVLTSKYHVRPVFTVNAGTSGASSADLPVDLVDTAVTPASSADIAAANSQLASSPLAVVPPMGSLVGTGLYEVKLDYTFAPDQQANLFGAFGGLTQTYGPAAGIPSALPAWEEGLWAPSQPGAMSRNQILSGWGHRANVVLADGVENAGYVAAVIGLNAR